MSRPCMCKRCEDERIAKEFASLRAEVNRLKDILTLTFCHMSLDDVHALGSVIPEAKKFAEEHSGERQESRRRSGV